MHDRRNILVMPRRRRPDASNHGITSDSSCTSPIDTDNDRPFEPDSSETDITEPECSPPVGGTITRKKPSPNTGTRSLPADLSSMERVHQARYQVPDDDTDEDLDQVPEDYGRSNKTKKLKLRLKERWAWWVAGI